MKRLGHDLVALLGMLPHWLVSLVIVVLGCFDIGLWVWWWQVHKDIRRAVAVTTGVIDVITGPQPTVWVNGELVPSREDRIVDTWLDRVRRP